MGCRRAGRSLAALLGTVNAAACMQFHPPPDPVPEAAACGCDTVWSASVGRSATGRLTVEEGLVILAGTDRTIQAVTADSGRAAWNRRLAGAILGGVVVDRGVVYAATERPQGEAVAVNLEHGDQKWRRRVGRSGVAPILTARHLVVSLRSGQVVALNRETGVEAWRREAGTSVTPLAARNDGAVLVTGNDSLRLLEPESGRVLRAVPSPGQAPAGWLLIGGVFIGGLARGTILAVDSATLAERWRHDLDSQITVPIAQAGDALLVVTQSGTVWSVPADGAVPMVRFRTGRPLAALSSMPATIIGSR